MEQDNQETDLQQNVLTEEGKMPKALIAYATRKNATKSIAELIGEGLRFGGIEATVMNIADLEKAKVNLEDFDAIVLGAPTYHGEMHSGMKTFLFMAEKANLEGKVGGAFGAYGWAGGAQKTLESSLAASGIAVETSNLSFKWVADKSGQEQCFNFGLEFAKKVQEHKK